MRETQKINWSFHSLSVFLWEAFRCCAVEGCIKWLHYIREFREKGAQSQYKDTWLLRKFRVVIYPDNAAEGSCIKFSHQQFRLPAKLPFLFSKHLWAGHDLKYCEHPHCEVLQRWSLRRKRITKILEVHCYSAAVGYQGRQMKMSVFLGRQ